jgi:hypothetical protein
VRVLLPATSCIEPIRPFSSRAMWPARQKRRGSAVIEGRVAGQTVADQQASRSCLCVADGFNARESDPATPTQFSTTGCAPPYIPQSTAACDFHSAFGLLNGRKFKGKSSQYQRVSSADIWSMKEGNVICPLNSRHDTCSGPPKSKSHISSMTLLIVSLQTNFFIILDRD